MSLDKQPTRQSTQAQSSYVCREIENLSHDQKVEIRNILKDTLDCDSYDLWINQCADGCRVDLDKIDNADLIKSIYDYVTSCVDAAKDMLK